MTHTAPPLPNLAESLGPILRRVSFDQRPLLIAAAERLAANRYRVWAEQVDASFKSGMLACAEREDDVARIIEAMFPNAATLQKELLAQAPELQASGSLFTAQSLKDQFRLQAQGERAGAATWRAYAEKAADETIRTHFLRCAVLEEESALHLESLLETE
jgi:bacterioferritin (cytochrome b1)